MGSGFRTKMCLKASIKGLQKSYTKKLSPPRSCLNQLISKFPMFFIQNYLQHFIFPWPQHDSLPGLIFCENYGRVLQKNNRFGFLKHPNIISNSYKQLLEFRENCTSSLTLFFNINVGFSTLQQCLRNTPTGF